MADTSIKISLELADAAAQTALSNFISKAAAADKASQSLQNSGSSAFNQIAISVGKAAGVFEIFEGSLAANIAGKAMEELLAIAGELFNTFIVDGVKAAEDTQNAINALNTSLAASGKYSQETSQDFQDFADKLEQSSTFGHAAILQNAALIESLAQLDSQGLKRATQAAVDMAAALGKDLPAASEIVAKAAEGNITSLTKLGLTIQKGRTDAETFANALTQIEARFSGAAQAQVNTYAGAVKQASNSFEDLIEQFGNLIVKNPVVIDAIKETSTIFLDLANSMKNQKGAVEVVGEGFVTLVGITAGVVTALDVLVRTFQVAFGIIEKMELPVVGLVAAFKSFTEGVDAGAKYVNDFTTQASANFNALGKSGDGALSTIAIDLLKVQDAAKNGLTELKNGADGTVAPLNNTSSAVTKLSAEMKLAQQQLLAFADALQKKATTGASTAADEIAQAKANAELLTAIDQNRFNRGEINQVAYLKDIAKINTQYDQQYDAAQSKEYDTKQTMLDKALAQNLISQNQYNIDRGQLLKDQLAQDDKVNADRALRDAKAKKALEDAERAHQNYLLGISAQAAGNLASLMSSSNSTLFGIGKAAAMSQAALNTIVGVSNALAGPPTGPPFPFNIALAASQGVALAVEEVKLAQQSPPAFASGGIVPGNNFSGDNLIARVNSGEMILNSTQQKNLFDIANNGGGSQIDYKKLASVMIAAIQTQPVHVHVGGKTIVGTLRNELKGGRTFN